VSSSPNADLAIHITPQTPLAPTIRSWEVFLTDQGRSLHTIKAFSNDVRLLASHLSPDRTLGTVTTPDIEAFLSWLQNKRGIPCSPKSFARRITAIKSFFRWLHNGGVLVINPAEKILQHSVISPLPIVLTPPEVEAVLQVADQYRRGKKPDARPYALLSLLLTTGIKKGECLSVSPNHLDFESSDAPILFVRYANPRNRYKERKIGLDSAWVDAYNEYAAQYPVTDRVFPWSPRRLEYLLEDLGEEAGLTKHLSFDMCRWTCALTDWQANLDTETIRQKLGISKIQWREISLKLRQLAASVPA
jgi:integrase/recombinase XerD